MDLFQTILSEQVYYVAGESKKQFGSLSSGPECFYLD